jgi:transcriptional regulator GlxA family with amidase domain
VPCTLSGFPGVALVVPADMTVAADAARRLPEDCQLGIEQVAGDCGYRTPEAMRRAFIHALGVPLASYRRRF